ncbi:MAG: hypothetical protein KC543_08230 [Myxococcales bacterium]|nr:hypothetical protein [Myxococcales bacterium]
MSTRPTRLVLLALASIVVLGGGLFAYRSCRALPPDVPIRADNPVMQAPAAANASAPARSPIGVNLAPVRDWSVSFPFVDVFKSSRPWFSGTRDTWDDGRKLDLDAHGWVRSLEPGQVARTLMLWGGHYRHGRYVVLYDGDGTIEYDGGGVARLVPGASTPGRQVIELDPKAEDTQGIAMMLVRTNPKDPVRNIRVLMPGGRCASDDTRWCDTAHPCSGAEACVPFESSYAERRFNPDFLAALHGFSILRFMDWANANDSKLARWDDRTTVDDARWTRDVPFEVMIDLANTLHADAWFTMPHRADDDFLRHAAELIHARLEAPARAWVEYSNEVWNWQFGQAAYAKAEGEKLGLGDGYDNGPKFYGHRSLQMFRIFEQAFAGTGRLVRVMAGQAANTYILKLELAQEDAYRHTDVIAIAPYFNLEPPADDKTLSRYRSMSLDALFRALRDESMPAAAQRVRDHVALGRRYGLPVVAYEAGQHLVGVGAAQEDDELNALFDAANRDRRMGAMYQRYLDVWREAGGTYLLQYSLCTSYSKYGRWGALEYITQPRVQAPKYQALERFIAKVPIWWGGAKKAPAPAPVPGANEVD